MYEYEPIHHEVWAKLEKLNEENFQLKRANTKLKGHNRRLRRALGKLRKETEQQQDKQHYRNNANRRNGK